MMFSRVKEAMLAENHVLLNEFLKEYEEKLSSEKGVTETDVLMAVKSGNMTEDVQSSVYIPYDFRDNLSQDKEAVALRFLPSYNVFLYVFVQISKFQVGKIELKGFCSPFIF